jgi:hypothetical protein
MCTRLQTLITYYLNCLIFEMYNINKNNKLLKNKQNNEIVKHVMNDHKWFIQ